MIVDSAADAPWERCARRAVPHTAADLRRLSSQGGRLPLANAQHVAAQRRAEALAGHVDATALLAELGLRPRPIEDGRWQEALRAAVGARSREQVGRFIESSLGR